MDTENLAADIFYASLKAVNSYESVKLYIDEIDDVYKKGFYNKMLVIGFGKAACPMAKAVEDFVGELIETGIVITKYGHCGGMGGLL
ncbi:MAG: DUF4147 domain-containing protein, partial [Nitrospirota bacterium]